MKIAQISKSDTFSLYINFLSIHKTRKCLQFIIKCSEVPQRLRKCEMSIVTPYNQFSSSVLQGVTFCTNSFCVCANDLSHVCDKSLRYVYSRFPTLSKRSKT